MLAFSTVVLLVVFFFEACAGVFEDNPELCFFLCVVAKAVPDTVRRASSRLRYRTVLA